MVKLLLEGGAEPNTANNGNTPLYWAVKGGHHGGHTQVVKLLLNAGAESNINILCLAGEIDNKDVVKLLIGEPNIPDVCKVGFKEVIGFSVRIFIFSL